MSSAFTICGKIQALDLHGKTLKLNFQESMPKNFQNLLNKLNKNKHVVHYRGYAQKISVIQKAFSSLLSA